MAAFCVAALAHRKPESAAIPHEFGEKIKETRGRNVFIIKFFIHLTFCRSSLLSGVYSYVEATGDFIVNSACCSLTLKRH